MPLKQALYARWPVFSGRWVARAVNVLRIHFQVVVTGAQKLYPKQTRTSVSAASYRVQNHLAGCTANQQIHS